MLELCQSNRNIKELSIILANIGGYMMDCHIAADGKIDLRPKKRNMRVGLWKDEESHLAFRRHGTHEDFIKPSTMGAAKPAGLKAGANAMKTFIFSFS